MMSAIQLLPHRVRAATIAVVDSHRPDYALVLDSALGSVVRLQLLVCGRPAGYVPNNNSEGR